MFLNFSIDPVIKYLHQIHDLNQKVSLALLPDADESKQLVLPLLLYNILFVKHLNTLSIDRYSLCKTVICPLQSLNKFYREEMLTVESPINLVGEKLDVVKDTKLEL